MDIRAEHRIACERLLRQEYPQTFYALDHNAKGEELRIALVADMWAKLKHPPQDAAGIDGLIHAPKFTDYLARAFKSPGTKNEDARWILATGWIRDGLYKMLPDELAKTLNPRTNLKLTGEAWYRRARRMGLVSDRSPGPLPRYLTVTKH